MLRQASGLAAVVFALIFTGGAQGDRCDQNELLRCSTPLPGLHTPADLSIALNRDELNHSCVELKASMKCIGNYTDHCMSPLERQRFNSMYEGVQSVMRQLCQRGTYQDDYLRHAACIKRVKQEYEMCSRSYELTLGAVGRQGGGEDGGGLEAQHEYHLRTVCCAFQEYMLCSEQTVQRSCGDEAALFTSIFLKRMASNIIKSYCLEYRGQECLMASPAARAAPGWLMPIVLSVAVLGLLSDSRRARSSLRPA